MSDPAHAGTWPRWTVGMSSLEYALPVALRRMTFRRHDRVPAVREFLRSGYSEDDARTLVEYLNERERV